MISLLSSHDRQHQENFQTRAQGSTAPCLSQWGQGARVPLSAKLQTSSKVASCCPSQPQLLLCGRPHDCSPSCHPGDS